MIEKIQELELYEIDALDIAYKLFTGDSVLIDMIGNKNNVYKVHIPEENRQEPPLVRISLLSELPKGNADNEQLGWDIMLQVDVWDAAPPRKIALRIHELMRSINFIQDTPTFEHDPETYLFRDCRRYRGIITKNLKGNDING